MFGKAPRARFRIYTRARDYARVAKDLLTFSATRGDDCERLERAVASRVGVPHAICMPQARVGIYLALKGLIRPGSKVVLSPYTIADVINMVICAGGVPVFADIDRPTTNVTAEEIEKRIDGDTGAVMVTHLHGMSCDIESIVALCRSRRLPLIEDTAQAFGARVNGKHLGTFGDAGIYSFGMYKNITGFYGGMVVTPSSALERRIRDEMNGWPFMPLSTLLAKVRQALFTDVSTAPPLFRAIVYWIFRFGYLEDVRWINKMVTIELDTSRKREIPARYLNRMRPMQARMILGRLGSIDEDARTRIRYAKVYHDGLKDLPGLVIPPFRDDLTHVYNYFAIQHPDRVALVKWMMSHCRDLAVQHLKNCAALPSFAPESRPCPNADLTANQVVLLPNYPSYGETEVRKNVAALRAFFEQRSLPDGSS